ncbi:YL-1 [Carabus blaptoides fortunei]
MNERARRVNAGNRMSKLLDEEEECKDDFYKTSYGGFEEEADDNEFVAQEDEVEDEVDSDFSIDENDEPVSDNEEENSKKKRRLVTKAYKEPVPAQQKQKQKLKSPKPKTTAKARRERAQLNDSYERKSIRRSTAAKSAATAQRIKVRNQEQKRKPRRNREDEWIPTQDELLEEAAITEKENLQSLEKYQKLENEKKIKRAVKKTYTGPMIRYHSLRMPIIDETGTEANEQMDTSANNEDNDNKMDTSSEIKQEIDSEQAVTKHCERTFITFLDDPNDEVFITKFPKTKPISKHKPSICAITGLKAKYIDPITNLPFNNINAFRIIREAYYQQLEIRGDRSNPKVEKFLQWRQKQKELRRENIVKLTRSVNRHNYH